MRSLIIALVLVAMALGFAVYTVNRSRRRDVPGPSQADADMPLLGGGPETAQDRDYRDHPDRLITCEHLQVVEAMLRRTDYAMRPDVERRRVSVGVNLDGPKLIETYHLPPFVHFSDMVTDTSAFGVLECQRCNTAIVEAGERSSAVFPA